MRGFWPKIAKDVFALRADFPHKLPKNHQALQRVYNEYFSQPTPFYACLINGRFGNVSASKITPEIENWMVKRLAETRQSIDMIHMQYQQQEAPRRGWPTDITASAFRARAAKKEVVQKVDLARHGREGYRKKHGQSFKLTKPKYANDIWFGDGSGTGWCYRRANNTIGYAYTYFVMDAHSKRFLAWVTEPHVNKENGIMQRKAYRSALRNTGYCQPYQIIVDNQGGHKTTESITLLKQITQSGHVTFSRPRRSKGRGIERAFMDFQTMKLSEFFFWSGYGRHTHSKLKNAPSKEFMEANKDRLPTYEDILKLLDVVVEEWNSMNYKDRPSPNELYHAATNPDAQTMDMDQVADMFWDVHGPVKYNTEGIKLRAFKTEVLDYEVYDEHGDVDYKFRKRYLHTSMYMKYDPDREIKDVELLIIHPTGGHQRIATASPKREVSRSIKYLNEGDRAWIHRQMNREDEHIDEQLDELNEQGYSEDQRLDAWQYRIGKMERSMAHDDEDDDDADPRHQLATRM